MITENDIFEQLKTYYSQADQDLLSKSCDFCRRAHHGRKMADGREYLQYSLEIASILIRLKVDETTLIVGILYDSLSSGQVSKEELLAAFGEEVVTLVETGSKISSIPYRQSNQQQVENFRKMFVSMARDLRVILVYLAVRLNAMRNIGYRQEQEQINCARETLEIYAPLANRLGISWLKGELEDLSLQVLEPEEYDALARRITAHKKERGEYVEKVREQICHLLAQNNLQGNVTGRFKHFYSVYRKMQRTGVGLEQIYDLTAFRVLVDSVRECYEVLGLIHATWKPIPGRFKDYIAMPKTNMYQSLHTTVVGPYAERMEVQIRTREMHRIAEEGVAAHWKYKEGGGAVPVTGRDDQRFNWLRQVLEWQRDVSTEWSASDTSFIDLFPEEVYVFTPNGDVKELPQGSCPIDFAYAVHTDVGMQCVGARINGKLCPLKTQLKNGDIVDVMTSAHQTPSKDWLAFVKTSKARNKIRHWVKTEQREKSIEIGRELLEKELRKHQYSLKRALSLDSFSQAVNDLGFKSADDIFASIGYGKLSSGQVVSHVLPKEEQIKQPGKSGALGKVLGKFGRRKPQSAILIGGIDNVMVRFANCCNPLPGEPVIGFITRGRGLTVHAKTCPQVLASDPERRIDVEWDMQRKTTRPVKIQVVCSDQKGMLVGISGAIADADANIFSASVHSRGDKKGSNLFEIDVENLEHLNRVIREIKKVKGVIRVERIRN
ncbi:bifunctional (p)ppGpp synthetase/guanosine-3',5'-bis(diphosphate) 3'-pyrophosphohydrolase [uncultured Desulfuromusa sp.]|uniref:RelA/SpoT family protein n=1 Tax=uncultured Desulfuromusa sp. TaxID=219183 RepID=UPI002AA7DF74|nr:bifunctional (p)ppGpp synthetase/guanosine-3',5'-bis(diphosphate) 3'-pyrophosphohydrolase [uncultured Desulfuromusa sp.]